MMHKLTNQVAPAVAADAKRTLWHASAANQTPQERARVAAGACWCGRSTQGEVTEGPAAPHQCSQCAEHCAIAAYQLTEDAS